MMLPNRANIKADIKYECLNELKERYGVGIYVDDSILKEQLKFVISFYTNKLEEYCKSHLILQHYLELIMTYKTVSDNLHSCFTKKDSTLLKRILLLVIGQSSNLDLIDDKKYQLPYDSLVLDLLFLVEIAELLFTYTDHYFLNFCFEKSESQFEIIQDDFSCTTMDEDFVKRFNLFIAKYKGNNNVVIKMNCDDNDYKDLVYQLFYCFGKDDFDKLFNEIIYDNFDSTNTNNDVYDITEDVREVMNSNADFVNAFILNNFNINISIMKPQDEQRLRYRPILRLSVDGEYRYFSSFTLLHNALSELASNRIPFGTGSNCLPKEWKNVQEMKDFASRLSNEKGILFEEMLRSNLASQYFVLTDLNKIGCIKLENTTIVENNVGQIDAIIFDLNNSTIFVADCKNRRSRFDWATWSIEKSYYERDSIKLIKKTEWVMSHLPDVAIEFNNKFKPSVDLNDFQVKSLFIVDTFTGLAFDHHPPIVMMRELNEWLNTPKKP